MIRFFCVCIVAFCQLGISAKKDSPKKYHEISNELWQGAVKTVKQDLALKLKSRAYKKKYTQEHISWVDISKVELQKAPLKLKFMNHIMGAPRKDILTSFVSPKSIKRIKAFMLTNKDAFKANEKQSGVDASGVVGVLYLETAFNASYVKYYPAIDTLLSLAALQDAAFRKEVVDQSMHISKTYKPSAKWQKRANWDARAKKIGERWTQELASYLALAQKLSWDKKFAQSRESSWAGAIGFSQFMPTTALRQIKSPDFDFWNWSQSIAFTSKELNHSGWKKSPKAALMKYNNVSWYGKTVLAIHEAIAPWWKLQ